MYCVNSTKQTNYYHDFVFWLQRIEPDLEIYLRNGCFLLRIVIYLCFLCDEVQEVVHISCPNLSV